ncbi:MAG: GTP-binding protein, partial [Prosthecobacter sp.]|nr:GTP-binding protein [Prosthecobacter sp.]
MLPITIVSGFLGSGKTTLLRRLLREQKDLRLGVIVNDMAELEVDGDLLRAGQRHSEERRNFASLYAGSISGDRRAAFATALDAWQGREDLQHVIVETSGSTHPWPLIQEILARPGHYRLDSFVTLIDARAFVEDYGAGRALFERLIRNEESGERSLENLLAEQVQFASTLLVTKTDRVRPDDLPLLLKCLEILNPHADVHAVRHGQVPAARLLGTGRFSAGRAQLLAAAWREEAGEDLGSSSAYGIGSSVLCDPRPFHPRRLWRLFHERLGRGIHRSKGFLWMASRDEQVLLWNQAAAGIDLELLAYWKAAVVKDPLGKLLPEEKAELGRQLEAAHPVFGDRLNELTIIGTLHDREIFMRELEACLCTPEEVARWQAGATFDDPWPKQLR